MTLLELENLLLELRGKGDISPYKVILRDDYGHERELRNIHLDNNRRMLVLNEDDYYMEEENNETKRL